MAQYLFDVLNISQDEVRDLPGNDLAELVENNYNRLFDELEQLEEGEDREGLTIIVDQLFNQFFTVEGDSVYADVNKINYYARLQGEPFDRIEIEAQPPDAEVVPGEEYDPAKDAYAILLLPRDATPEMIQYQYAGLLGTEYDGKEQDLDVVQRAFFTPPRAPDGAYTYDEFTRNGFDYQNPNAGTNFLDTALTYLNLAEAKTLTAQEAAEATVSAIAGIDESLTDEEKSIEVKIIHAAHDAVLAAYNLTQDASLAATPVGATERVAAPSRAAAAPVPPAPAAAARAPAATAVPLPTTRPVAGGPNPFGDGAFGAPQTNLPPVEHFRAPSAAGPGWSPPPPSAAASFEAPTPSATPTGPPTPPRSPGGTRTSNDPRGDSAATSTPPQTLYELLGITRDKANDYGSIPSAIYEKQHRILNDTYPNTQYQSLTQDQRTHLDRLLAPYERARHVLENPDTRKIYDRIIDDQPVNLDGNDWYRQDLYVALNLGRNATSEQIDAAYDAYYSLHRSLYGYYPLDEHEVIDKEIAHLELAYTILSNPDQRQAFDNTNPNAGTTPIRDHYKALGLEKTATTEEIDEAINTIPEEKKGTYELFEATHILLNQDRKAAYDTWAATVPAPAPVSPRSSFAAVAALSVAGTAAVALAGAAFGPAAALATVATLATGAGLTTGAVAINNRINKAPAAQQPAAPAPTPQGTTAMATPDTPSLRARAWDRTVTYTEMSFGRDAYVDEITHNHYQAILQRTSESTGVHLITTFVPEMGNPNRNTIQADKYSGTGSLQAIQASLSAGTFGSALSQHMAELETLIVALDTANTASQQTTVLSELKRLLGPGAVDTTCRDLSNEIERFKRTVTHGVEVIGNINTAPNENDDRHRGGTMVSREIAKAVNTHIPTMQASATSLDDYKSRFIDPLQAQKRSSSELVSKVESETRTAERVQLIDQLKIGLKGYKAGLTTLTQKENAERGALIQAVTNSQATLQTMKADVAPYVREYEFFKGRRGPLLEVRTDRHLQRLQPALYERIQSEGRTLCTDQKLDFDKVARFNPLGTPLDDALIRNPFRAYRESKRTGAQFSWHDQATWFVESRIGRYGGPRIGRHRRTSDLISFFTAEGELSNPNIDSIIRESVDIITDAIKENNPALLEDLNYAWVVGGLGWMRISTDSPSNKTRLTQYNNIFNAIETRLTQDTSIDTTEKKEMRARAIAVMKDLRGDLDHYGSENARRYLEAARNYWRREQSSWIAMILRGQNRDNLKDNRGWLSPLGFKNRWQGLMHAPTRIGNLYHHAPLPLRGITWFITNKAPSAILQTPAWLLGKSWQGIKSRPILAFGGVLGLGLAAICAGALRGFPTPSLPTSADVDDDNIPALDLKRDTPAETAPKTREERRAEAVQKGAERLQQRFEAQAEKEREREKARKGAAERLSGGETPTDEVEAPEEDDRFDTPPPP